MTAWFRRACDRATNLGLSMAVLSARVHGQVQNRQMVELALSLEEALRLRADGRDEGVTAPELAARADRLFRDKTGKAAA